MTTHFFINTKLDSHQKSEELLNKVISFLSPYLNLDKKYLEIYLVEDEFNVHSYEPAKDFQRPDVLGMGLVDLGEIHLNPDFIKTKDESLLFMFIHGLLHLLGHTHNDSEDTKKMEQKEEELVDFLVKKGFGK